MQYSGTVRHKCGVSFAAYPGHFWGGQDALTATPRLRAFTTVSRLHALPISFEPVKKELGRRLMYSGVARYVRYGVHLRYRNKSLQIIRH